MTVARAREYGTFALLTGYLVFDYAFMALRIPPSSLGAPIGELFLAAALITINIPLAIGKMGSAVYLLPFLIWWGLGFIRLMIGGMQYGIWAFRDGTQLIESLFIIVGLVAAGDARFIARFMRWLPWVLLVTCIYGFGYLWAPQIAAISPKLPGSSINVIPLLGTYALTPTIMLWTAFYLSALPHRHPKLRYAGMVIAALLVSFAVVVVQARTIYTQMLAMLFLLLIFRRQGLGRMVTAFPLLILLIAIITAFDISISGRLTNKISFSFFADHFDAIFGQSDSATLAAPAKGVDLRFSWWERIYNQLIGDPVTFLIGLGFGVPLTDFRDEQGTLVREPHNSYISVVARLGVVGFLAWFWMYIEMFKAWLGSLRLTRRLRWRDGEDFLLMALCFNALLFAAACGEDTMEKPYDAIPLYIFWGFALRIAYALKLSRAAAKSAAQAVFAPTAGRSVAVYGNVLVPQHRPRMM